MHRNISGIAFSKMKCYSMAKCMRQETVCFFLFKNSFETIGSSSLVKSGNGYLRSQRFIFCITYYLHRYRYVKRVDFTIHTTSYATTYGNPVIHLTKIVQEFSIFQTQNNNCTSHDTKGIICHKVHNRPDGPDGAVQRWWKTRVG